MATLINTKNAPICRKNKPVWLENIRRFLPQGLCLEIESFLVSSVGGSSIEEIRLRADRQAYLTLGGSEKRNLMLNSKTSYDEISEILGKMCEGSLYAYGESIVKGYISLSGGIRVGICGHASLSGSRIIGIYNVSALNIRIPCGDVLVDDKLIERVRALSKQGKGTLIYSPPAQGKTTLLRNIAKFLSGGKHPMRVAVVDARDELGAFLGNDRLSVDILYGYPQAEGIRIATTFMNPEVILCDEIGSEEDAKAIAHAQNCGVPLVATTHASSVEGLLMRSGMKHLYNIQAFDMYIGIKINEKNGFEYKFQNRGEIDCEFYGSSATPV